MRMVIVIVDWRCSDIAIELLMKLANEISDKTQTIIISLNIVDSEAIEVPVLVYRRHQVHCRYW